MEQEVRWPVASVKIGSGIVILIQAEIVRVEAEVNVKSSVSIVVRDGSMGKCSLRRLHKFEGIGLELKSPVPLVQE